MAAIRRHAQAWLDRTVIRGQEQALGPRANWKAQARGYEWRTSMSDIGEAFQQASDAAILEQRRQLEELEATARREGPSSPAYQRARILRARLDGRRP